VVGREYAHPGVVAVARVIKLHPVCKALARLGVELRREKNGMGETSTGGKGE
jgi:hypothetical protein